MTSSALAKLPLPEPTGRLRLRLPKLKDARFYLALLNEPDYIRFITDTKVRTIRTAEAFIKVRSLPRFEKYGTGLWVVERLDTGEPIGICGLIVREELDCPDLGYAFLAAQHGKGYAREAAGAAIAFAREIMKLDRLCAIIDPDNERSAKLLTDLGFIRDGQRRLESIGSVSDYFEKPLSACACGEAGQ
ncbi:GNAT family N-acetyltransferase [Roseibium suaedae]|uniref:Protein N-acetyltransferase, RimJ/RimL family n=1 Tax=Roseibium suaedae TaxID=735517 RepID=A0A1M7MGJ6_9HYPH|nr:GNAT family N-acetyltransferase [Roseibium suaedae]SHM89975.1 Protein N-acetyltransferase, RimJ/RimL family [Roseibium suaedae]